MQSIQTLFKHNEAFIMVLWCTELIVCKIFQYENEVSVMHVNNMIRIITSMLFHASRKQFILAKEIYVLNPAVLHGFKWY